MLDNGTADEEEQWLPLGIEDEHQVVAFTALREDIPAWLDTSLWEWIARNFLARRYDGQTVFKVELLRQAERELQIPLPIIEPHQVSTGIGELRMAYNGQGAKAVLALVDFLMRDLHERHSHLADLEQVLVQARSAWRVGTRCGHPGLVRRLPRGVEVAAAAAIQHPNAGKRLVTAWESAFGVNPDPSKAYWFAVKAVEDASAPLVIPNDLSPTLGKVISRIEQGGQFKLPHLRENPDATSHEVLLKTLKLLWVGEHDRHGGMPQSPLPDDVTQDEAETAVMTAVTLVGWFETGKVQQ